MPHLCPPPKIQLSHILTLSPVLPSSPKPEYFLRQVLHPKAAVPWTQSPHSLQQTSSSVLQSLWPYKAAQLCPTQNAAAKNVFLACHPDHSNPFSNSPTISIILAYKAFHNLSLLRQPEGLALSPHQPVKLFLSHVLLNKRSSSMLSLYCSFNR